MKKINKKYYEPLEQMMAVRHQYMAKIIKKSHNITIQKFFKNRNILDLGCGTGEFIHNYYELGSICIGVDKINNFKFKNKKNFNLIISNINNFLKKNKIKFDVVFLYEILEHLNYAEKKILFKKLSTTLNNNALIFVSTLNDNMVSRFFSINIAEDLLNLLPKKTHDHKLFLSPTGLKKIIMPYKFQIFDIEGISYNPLIKTFTLSKIDLINYFVTIKN